MIGREANCETDGQPSDNMEPFEKCFSNKLSDDRPVSRFAPTRLLCRIRRSIRRVEKSLAIAIVGRNTAMSPGSTVAMYATQFKIRASVLPHCAGPTNTVAAYMRDRNVSAGSIM